MERRIAQFLPHTCHQRLNLDPVPTKHPRKQRIAIGRHGFDHVDLVVTTELLHLGVLGPGALGELLLPLAFPCAPGTVEVTYLINVLANVDEAGVFHLRPPILHGVEILAEFLGTDVHVLDSLHHRCCFEMCVIVGEAVDFDRGDFKPSTGLQVRQGLSEQAVVVADEAF